jgi:hypothetical protein
LDKLNIIQPDIRYSALPDIPPDIWQCNQVSGQISDIKKRADYPAGRISDASLYLIYPASMLQMRAINLVTSSSLFSAHIP